MKLVRLSQSNVETLGQLINDEEQIEAKTLELPWRNNVHSISCIPAGEYVAVRRFSPEHKCEVFEITGVPDRQDIEIHWGNYTKDTKGCVILGASFADINSDGQTDVTASLDTFQKFMHAHSDVQSFPLSVIDAPEAQAAAA